MSLQKSIQVILFFALLITSTFAAASDSSSSEAKFAMKALPFLQVSGYPWTRESAQGFMHVVNEECGYRGMQIFLAMLREKFTEADQEKIEFACPVLSLVDMSSATIDDPLGLGMEIIHDSSIEGAGKSVLDNAFMKLLAKVWSKSLPVRVLWNSYQAYDLVGWELGRLLAINAGLPDPGKKPNLTMLQKIVYKVAGK